jgi:hypothetical protein
MDRRTWKEPVDERIVADGIFLEQRAALRITGGASLLVAAHAGALWITEEGDTRDVIVTNGRSYRIESNGLAIVNALEPTSVTISAPLGIPARWTIEGAAPGGVSNGVRIRPRKRGGQTGRDLLAWVLRCYRSGARVARGFQQSAREAARRADIARFAAQLDARTRRDIGLEPFYSPVPAERAEQYRWSHDYSWPARENRFI